MRLSCGFYFSLDQFKHHSLYLIVISCLFWPHVECDHDDTFFISKLFPYLSRWLVLLILDWSVVEQTLLNEKPTFPVHVNLGFFKMRIVFSIFDFKDGYV